MTLTVALLIFAMLTSGLVAPVLLLVLGRIRLPLVMRGGCYSPSSPSPA